MPGQLGKPFAVPVLLDKLKESAFLLGLILGRIRLQLRKCREQT